MCQLAQQGGTHKINLERTQGETTKFRKVTVGAYPRN